MAGRRVHASPSMVWRQDGYPFNQAVVEPDGRRVHLAGQVAWDSDGRVIGANDPAIQTRVALENPQTVLASLDGDLSDIVSLTTYFVRDEDKAAISRVRSEFLREETEPVATGMRVGGLWAPEVLVELTAIAIMPHDRFQAREDEAR